MKILAIGDLHGKNVWKLIADPEKFDKIVFVGDYMDSWDKADEEMTTNLLDLIEFKKANMDKVVLLLGNHDIPYMYSYHQFPCSGHRYKMYPLWNQIFNDNQKLFQIAYQYKNYLFTHAGVTRKWYEAFKGLLNTMPSESLADQLNMLQYTAENKALHLVGHLRNGRSKYGGVTWADQTELINWPLAGYHQIVGHNITFPPLHYRFMDEEAHEDCSITFIDCLDKAKQFLVLDDHEEVEELTMITPDNPHPIDLITKVRPY